MERRILVKNEKVTIPSMKKVKHWHYRFIWRMQRKDD